MTFPVRRLRRMRRTEKIRELLQETKLSPSDLVAPVFVQEDLKHGMKIGSMPDLERLPIDGINDEVGKIADSGIPAIMLFGIPSSKDDVGTSAFDENGIVQKSIAKIKSNFGDKMVIMTDVCLCQYTATGHCGITRKGIVDNDASIDVLARIAASHARAGADVVCPSAMMDGQVARIRSELDQDGFSDVAIMSHSAKHRSSFYSPFRDAAECAPRFGDRKTYQVPFTNAREAMREIESDIEEGVDIVMIKPALSYLDLIHQTRQRFNIPVSAYSVSGEYALVKGAAAQGWINEDDIVREILYSIKRSGADIIITYFAKSASKFLNDV